MSAADIPEAGYRSSHHMARVLSSYISDPKAVRLRILEDFDQAPELAVIRRMCENVRVERKPALSADFKVHEGYYPGEASLNAEAASIRFLERLRLAHPERCAG